MGDDKIDWGIEQVGGTDTLIRPEDDVTEPSLYRVVILNDDFTPKDFVVHVLKRYFQKDETSANELMMQVHSKGRGIAGVYPHEVAETKTYQVNSYSKENQYPLKTVMEEV